MHAYGHSRKDKQECIYGCCTGKSGKKKNCRKVVDKANKKTARRLFGFVDLIEFSKQGI